MKVVSLVSGGKDSCYNMVLCQHYGHEIVALANLLPPQHETDDLDSYMYQTVGHQLIAAYARCMRLPLYRRAITGCAADQRLVYQDTEGDEVEDLYCLLAFVKQAHPEVTAVASGAIASDYQRTRVERVCSRLGLVSLAYLWHQPQAPLLQRMIAAEVDAILVKVAAAGLVPAKHLGAHLATLPAQLHALRRLYGSNVCGEGGEYESLTLDCPALFTHGRIVLDSWEAVTVSPDSMAPVALLHPTAFHVEAKQSPLTAAAANGEADAAGAVAREAAAEVAAVVVEVPADWAPAALPAPAPAADEAAEGALDVQLGIVDGSQYCTVSASVATPGIDGPDLTSAAGTATGLSAALRRVSDALPALGLGWGSSLFVHLYVPSMAQFGAANAAYAAFLPAVNPPSRATVELCSTSQLAMVVEVLLARREEGRRVLHVQSISEWAPSCIGPYSQATRHQGLVHFAGQIALDPATMGIVAGGIDEQCARCLLSCQRVAVAVQTDLARSLLWCTVYCSEAAGEQGRQRAAAHLCAFLGVPLDTSALGERRNAGSVACESDSRNDSDSGSEEEAEDVRLDDYLRPPHMHRHWQPLLTFVTVPQLPRGVLVEVQPVACVVDASLVADSSSSSDDGERSNQPAAVAARRTSRRAAASAARPDGSTMPGWIGRVQQHCSSSSSCLWSPGRLARVQAWVSAQQPGSCWRQALGAAAGELSERLAAAGLAADDVAVCKAYCRSSLLDAQHQLPAGQEGRTAAMICNAVQLELPGVQPTLVPVSAVGINPAADCSMLLEVLAVRVEAICP